MVSAQESWQEFVAKFTGDSDSRLDDKIKLIGYTETIKKVEEKIKFLLDHDITGFQGPTLITGPSGTGKSIVVRSLGESYAQKYAGFNFFHLELSWTLNKVFGNPESRLVQLFDEAIAYTRQQNSASTLSASSRSKQARARQNKIAENAASLIFIDDLETICGEKRNEAKDRIFSALLGRLKMLEILKPRVLVLAATNNSVTLDSKIRGHFYVNEIKFSLPTPNDRFMVLTELTNNSRLKLDTVDIQKIADGSHCCLYRNLEELCNIAEEIRRSSDCSPKDAMFTALEQYRSAKIKSITTPCPPLRWDDIGGVNDVKQELQESVIWPLEHRDKFENLGIKSNKGALLYGPPGCSKTMLAQALATESGYNFISVKGPELYSKWVGDSEAAVRNLYRNARDIAPCIIFFDEIDGLAPERSDSQSSPVGDKVVAQLLTELNGIDPLDNVFTIAATNRPDRVDSALLRPGRLDPAIYIQLPSREDRAEIFKVHMRPLSLKFHWTPNEFICELARRTKGYSGAEIANICRIAGVFALRESLNNSHIEEKHFEQSLEQVKPRTRADQLKAYEKFHKMSLQLGQRESLAGPTVVGEICDDFRNIAF